MTPLERAAQIMNSFRPGWYIDSQVKEYLIDRIQIAIVEATNEELERRRAAEKLLDDTEDVLDIGWRKVGMNLRIGRISKLFSPGFSSCGRCLTTWTFVPLHRTPIEGGTISACFPLCQKCWAGLTPDERLPFYRDLAQQWGPYYDKLWPAISAAVNDGL